MALTVGGLASGIDVQSLIDKLVAVAQQPLTSLSNKKNLVDSASKTITTFSSKLATLKTAAAAMATTTEFSTFSTTSSDAAIVATASGSANVGSYAIEVTDLARAQKSRSTTVGSRTDALGMSGPLTITDGKGNATSVDVITTDSLADIAAKLSSSGARVSASIVADGSNFRLLVQGYDSGAENAFTITQGGDINLGLATPASIYETALDAAYTIDGIPGTSKTNQISDVIPGVKLALTKKTTSPVTVSVATDTTALATKVTAFVNAYNDMVNTAHTATGFGSVKATNSELAGDSSIRSALRRVGAIVGDRVDGTTGKYTTLGSVGIKLTNDGTLKFDSTTLSDAIAADPNSVRRLFVTDKATGATGIMNTLMTAVDKLVTGSSSTIQARLDSLAAQSKRITDAGTAMQDRITAYQTQLTKQFSAMDAAVGKYNAMKTSLDAAFGTSSSST